MAFSGSSCAASGLTGLVAVNLGTFLFLYVELPPWDPPQNHFFKVILVSLRPFFTEAYFSGCLWKPVLRVVLHIRSGLFWNLPWYLIDFLTCLNEPISGTFISLNPQLL